MMRRVWKRFWLLFSLLVVAILLICFTVPCNRREKGASWTRCYKNCVLLGGFARGLIADSQGNVYVSGSFTACDFDPGWALDWHLAPVNAFLVKYDENGKFQYSRTWADRSAYLIATTPTGEFFVRGTSRDAGCYVRKFNREGVFLWAREWEANAMMIDAACIDILGNLLIAGSLYKTLDIDPGASVDIVGAGQRSLFIVELDGDGQFKSANVWTAELVEGLENIACDDTGNVYVAGHKYEGPEAGSGEVYKAYVTKYGPNWSAIWTLTWGDYSTSYETYVAIDGTQNILVLGGFMFKTDLDPGPGTLMGSSQGPEDLFLVKVDPSGALVWGRTLGEAGSDAPTGLLIDNHGAIYVWGHNSTSSQGLLYALDRDGVLQWKKAGGQWHSQNLCALDNTGNLYIVQHSLFAESLSMIPTQRLPGL